METNEKQKNKNRMSDKNIFKLTSIPPGLTFNFFFNFIVCKRQGNNKKLMCRILLFKKYRKNSKC